VLLNASIFGGQRGKKYDFGCFDFGVVKRWKDVVVGFLVCFGFALMGYCHLRYDILSLQHIIFYHLCLRDTFFF
jgi:hypothetical protein